jgi:type I restriction enzyme S subunit
MQTDCFPDAIAEWSKGPISKLAIVNPRYSMKKGREYPFVEMASVGENFAGILQFEARSLEGSGLSRFRVGDTLFAKITPCPQNGKVAFVETLPGDIGLGSTEFIVLSPRPGTVPRFLYHLACTYAVRGRAAARMEGSTGRQRVPEEVFSKRLLVPLPDPYEQTAIARVLDTVDIAIERSRAAIERARELERAVLEHAVEGLHAPQCRLRDFIADIRYGTSKASSDRSWGNPVLRIPNVVADRLSLDDLAFVELPSAEVDRLQLWDGDLLLVRTNGNPNYVGRSVVFRRPDARIWVYASYLIRVRLKSGLLPEYVNVFLGLERGRRELLRRVTTSAGNHNINSNSIRLLRLPVPASEDSQARIVELAGASRAHVDVLRTKAGALQELKKSLMHDLLTGRVRVTNAVKVAAS